MLTATIKRTRLRACLRRPSCGCVHFHFRSVSTITGALLIISSQSKLEHNITNTTRKTSVNNATTVAEAQLVEHRKRYPKVVG